MEKAGGVFLSILMGAVLCFALVKIYSHEQNAWVEAHFGPTFAASATESTKKEAPLPCRS